MTTGMPYEVEQKFRLADAAALKARLLELAAPIGDAVTQSDRYFNHPARDFAKTDEALRIRSVGEQNFVTYKGPKVDATTKTRREIELAIPPGAAGARQFAEMLVALGFREVATVRKQRRTAHCAWQGRTAEIAIDNVVGVGEFCEIELSADEADLPAARDALAGLAARLGLAGSERRSYLELLLGR
jgi:adenylate cyclase class 2